MNCAINTLSMFIFKEDLTSLTGLLISSFPAAQYGALFCRYLEMCKSNALKQSRGNFDSKMTLR